MLNFRLAQPARLVDLNGIGGARLSALRGRRAADRGAHATGGARALGAGRARLAVAGRCGAPGRPPGDPQPRDGGRLGCARRSCRRTAGRAGRARRAVSPALGPWRSNVFRRASSSSVRLTTVLEPDELLVEIEVPALPEGTRAAFVEQARTHGDFAIAGAAVVACARSSGRDSAARGRGQRSRGRPRPSGRCWPVRRRWRSARLAAVGVDGDYRRALLTELVRRAVAAALP